MRKEEQIDASGRSGDRRDSLNAAAALTVADYTFQTKLSLKWKRAWQHSGVAKTAPPTARVPGGTS